MPQASDDVITATDLKKSFKSRRGPVEAVRGVSINVQRGEIFGFLGPNGAGKTTTLRMLTTLLPIDSGTASVAGYDVARASRAGARPHRLRQPAGRHRSARHRPGEPAAAGPALRPGQERCPRAQRGTDGRARPARVRRPQGDDVLRRADPAPRHRPGHRPRPAGALPRRAHHRPRPAEPGEPLGAHPAPARARHDGLPHHALPRGGRRALRPARDHGPRQGRHRRHTPRAQAAGRG